MKKSRLFLILLLLMAGAGGVWALLRARQAATAQADWETASAQRGSFSVTAGATGRTRAAQSAQLAWKVTGTVGELPVKVGQTVAAGQTLATLRLSSLPSRVILAQADLVSAHKTLADLQNPQLQQAQALQAVQAAQQELDDLKNSTLSQSQAQQAVAQAQQALDDAQRWVAILTTPPSQAALNQTHANLLLAEKKLKDTQDQIKRLENLMKKLPLRFRSGLRKALRGLDLALAQDQLAYDRAARKYQDLQQPADPVEVAAARGDLAAAEAKLADAQREWERVKAGPSPADIALAEAKLADAQRKLDQVKDGPNPDDLAVAQARVAAAEATLSMAQITAPFSGTITAVNSQVGDQVAPGAPAFRLDDLSHLLVDAEVSEVDVNQVAVGQPVTLSFDSILAQEYHGQVTAVAAVGETVQGVVNFTVTVELADADAQVKPGMTAAVTIVVSEVQDALLVPNRAVRVVDGKRVVYVLKDGQPQKVEVVLGKSSDTHSEVTGGDLKQGDLIVLNPPSTFEVGPGGGGGGPFGGNRQQ